VVSFARKGSSRGGPPCRTRGASPGGYRLVVPCHFFHGCGASGNCSFGKAGASHRRHLLGKAGTLEANARVASTARQTFGNPSNVWARLSPKRRAGSSHCVAQPTRRRQGVGLVEGVFCWPTDAGSRTDSRRTRPSRRLHARGYPPYWAGAFRHGFGRSSYCYPRV